MKKTKKESSKKEKEDEKLTKKPEGQKEKPNHKKRNIIITIIAVIILIIILVIVFVGIRVNFLINDELTINLKPLDQHLITTYGQEKNVTFEFENDNSFLCKSKCSYQFIDISKNKTVNQETLIINSKTKVSKFYQIIPKTFGSGQEIYSFQVTCNNIKNFICKTDQEERFKSSFITLSYDLSEEEKVKLSSIYENLVLFLKNLTNLDIKNQKLQYEFLESSKLMKNTLFNLEIFLLEDELETLNSNVNDLIIDSIKMINLWGNNEFSVLTEMINNNTISINNSFSDVEQKNQRISNLIVSYNSLISGVEILSNKSLAIGSIINYHNLTNTSLLQNSIDFKNNLSSLSLLFYDINFDKENFSKKVSDLNSLIDYLINNTNTTLTKSNFSYLNINIIYLSQINKTFTSNVTTEVKQKQPICCVFGKCKNCCTTNECKNDPRLYPILFIHGHAFNKDTSPETSLNSFAKLQRELQKDGIINAGQIDLQNLENIPPGEYGKSGNPISVRASYYYIHYYDLGAYLITTQKSERIENYALRLNEIINVVKERTGSDKLNIVAHSMGGLVAREYIRIFSDVNINKLVLVATPNKGTSGKTQQFCSFLGSQKECEDMAEGSIFLKRLNQITKSKNVKVYTITTIGENCDTSGFIGDGIVKSNNIILDYATNFNITGKCTDVLKSNFHHEVLDSEKYPEILKILKNILKE